MTHPPLTLVVSGAPLAARTVDVVAHLRSRWTVSVLASDAARQWFVGPGTSGHPDPERVVVCPLTFNSANKVAAGVADNLVVGALCEALGVGVPIVAVTTVNDRLWRHPTWSTTLRMLTDAGVRWVDARSGAARPAPVPSGTGARVVDGFDPRWLDAALG